jgi:hypothetical protein
MSKLQRLAYNARHRCLQNGPPGKAVRAGLAFGGRIQPYIFAPEDRQNKRETKKVGLDVANEQRG